jgi:hypothetical protein
LWKYPTLDEKVRKVLNSISKGFLLMPYRNISSVSSIQTQIISGLKIVSLNSRVFCSPGMGPNVAVLHVDDSNFASGLLNFNF